MSKLEELNQKNPFPVYSVEDKRFQSYGRILPSLKADELIRCAERETEIPESGNVYVASHPELESYGGKEKLEATYFGKMPIQIGYCNGKNSTVNGFEFHKNSEINIALTDFCLALGHSYEIGANLSYPVEKAEFFYVPKGTAFEMFGTTLHLSPLRTEEKGFKNIVILPKGTNTPLSEEEKKTAKKAYEQGDGEARLLLQKGKWVIAHPEREPLIKQGAHPGVIGQNIELKY